MPSKQHQIVVRITDEQLAWLQALADVKNDTIANVMLTPFRQQYPEFSRLSRVRQWNKKAKSK